MVWFASDKRWNESLHIPDVVVDVVDVVDVEDVAVNFIVIPIYLGKKCFEENVIFVL